MGLVGALQRYGVMALTICGFQSNPTAKNARHVGNAKPLFGTGVNPESIQHQGWACVPDQSRTEIARFARKANRVQAAPEIK